MQRRTVDTWLWHLSFSTSHVGRGQQVQDKWASASEKEADLGRRMRGLIKGCRFWKDIPWYPLRKQHGRVSSANNNTIKRKSYVIKICEYNLTTVIYFFRLQCGYIFCVPYQLSNPPFICYQFNHSWICIASHQLFYLCTHVIYL